MPALVAACSIAVSLPGAVGHALWGDEVASARVLSEPDIGGVVGRVHRAESTPPSWYILAWTLSEVDGRLTGGAVLAPVERLRLLSVLFAAGTAALTAWWARRLLGDPFAAGFAGTLVALGSVPLAYAEQLRAYALFMLISVLFGLVLVEWSRRPGLLPVAGLAVCEWLGTMTHYFFVFTSVAGGIWLWTSRPPHPRRAAVTLGLALGWLAFLPWLPSFLDQLHVERYRWIGSFEGGSVATLAGSLFFGPQGTLYGLARVAVTGAILVGALALWRKPPGSAIVALALLPIGLAALVWALGKPVFDERNMLGATPFLAILAAASLLTLPKRLVAPFALAAIAAVVVAAGVAHVTLGRTPYDRIADTLVRLGWKDRDSVVIDVPAGETSLRVALAWYLPGHPRLAHGRTPGRPCRTVYAIGHSASLGRWLSRHRDRLEVSRELPWFDHPARGRERGHIVVARLRGPAHPPGERFSVRKTTAPC